MRCRVDKIDCPDRVSEEGKLAPLREVRGIEDRVNARRPEDSKPKRSDQRSRPHELNRQRVKENRNPLAFEGLNGFGKIGGGQRFRQHNRASPGS